MAAIVSGGAVGILQSSAALLGSAGQLGAAAHGRAGERIYLNAATGNLVIQGQDEILVGRGPDAALLRTYNSQGLLNDDNGDNWRLNFHRRVYNLSGTVNTVGSTVTRVDADGAEAVYAYNATLGKYVTTEGSGAYDTLSHNAGTWTWTDGDSGVTETYDGANGGRLTSVVDESGNALAFGYNGAGLLTSVQTQSETTYLDYAGNNLTQIRTVKSGGTTLIRTSYAYDGSNRLTQVITDLTPENTGDSKTYITTYAYDGSSRRVASMMQTDGTTVSFGYTLVGSDYRVTQITQTVGGVQRVTGVSYNTANRTTTITDPLSRATVLAYDTSNRLTGITLPAVGGVSQQVSYAYDGSGNVTSVTDAKGNAVVYSYDANGNRVYERDAAGNVVERLYGAKNELLNEIVYQNPDPDGAGSGQPSGAQSTRYAYDANTRLRFEIAATGRVTEHRYNGLGQRVATIQYTGATYDLTGISSSTTLSEAQLVAWLPADRSKSMRSDSAYDFRGQLSTVTTYAAVDSAGNGIAAGQSIAQLVYDQAGNLLQTIDGRNFQTSYVYDGLGRLLSTTDALNRVTLSDYQDANRKTVVTLANGLVRTSTYSAAGELISLLESANSTTLSETKYFYDDNGRLRRTEDPTGLKSYVLYDEAGRKVAEIDGDASFTEFRYDANNNLTSTIRYATPVTATALATLANGQGVPQNASLASIRPAVHFRDRPTWSAYDSANRLVKSVDALGGVTQMVYDGLGNLVQTVRYATAISTAGLGDTPLPSAINPATSSADRVTRNFHDAQGKLLATLDAAGYLVEYKYDAAGQLNETVAYATATNPALRASGTLADLRPAAASGDVSTHTLYNARGQRAGEVDGEGYLNETVYDAAGNKTQVIRYATRVTWTASSTLASLRPASTAQDEVHTYTYDALNRVASETNPVGIVTQHTYDEVGNLTKSVQAVGTGDVRTLNAQYDKQGRLTAELSGVGSALLTGSQTQTEIDAIWSQYAVKHTYDAAGRRKSTTDALGNRTLFYYDGDGRLEYTISATGEVRRCNYGTLGQLVQTETYGTRLSGATLATLNGGLIDATLTAAITGIANAAIDTATSYLHYHTGVLAQTIDALGNVTSYTYNAFNEITGTEQPNGVVTQRSYDANGRVSSSIVDPGGLNLKTTFAYDALGRTLTLTEGTDSANPRVTQYQYDKLGRVLSETVDPGTTPHLNLVTTYAYDKNGNVTQKTDAKGFVTRYYYDANDRLVFTLDAANGVVKTVYDSLGRVAQTIAYANAVSLPANPTLTDVQNAVQPSAGGDAVTTSVYDKDGHESYSVDGLNGVTRKIYDKAGNVVERIVYATMLPAGTALNATAIAAAQATNAADRSTRIAYDTANRPVYEIDASGAVTQTVYDEKGNVARTVRYANAVSLSGQPNAAQVAAALTPSAALDRSESRFYDNANRLVYSVDALGYAKETRYDAASRITSTVQYAAPITLDSTPTRAEVAAALAALPANTPNQTNSFAYDNADRLASSTDAGGFTESFSYDAVGNKLSFTNKKGSTWTYQYDANRRLVKEFSPVVAVTSVSPGLVATTSNVQIETRIAYDGLGNVTSRIEAYGLSEARTTTYEYDALGRQVRTNYPQFGVYNAAGDDLTTNGISGTVNRVETTQVLYSTVTYDALGKAVVSRDAAGNYSYKVYDVQGRLRFDIDAERYVSEHKFNVLGDEIELTRYATALSFAGHPNGAAPFTESEVTTALATSAQDRKLITSYDKLGRSIQVDEPSAFNYDPTAAAGSQTFSSGRITKNTFDAFSQVVKQSSLKNSVTNEWIDTYTYFDRSGHKTAQVDALGYLTKWEYDETGDVTREVQYAAALAGGSWSLTGYPANPATTTPVNAPNSAIGYDREVTYAYDRKNQKISEARVNAEYGKVTGSLGLTTEVANLTTTYGYDALGNAVRVTDPSGASTYTYYDVLGRINAVAEAPRVSESTTAPVVIPPLRVAYDTGSNGVTLRFAVQTSSNTVVGFRYAKAGTTSWTTVTPSVQGTDYVVSPSGLTSDNYIYEITYTKTGESSVYATGSGSFDVLGPTSVAATNVAATVEKPALGGSIASTARFDQVPGDEGGYTLVWNGSNQVNLSWNSLDALGNGNVRVRVNYFTYAYQVTGSDGEGGYTYGVTGNGTNTYREVTYSASQANTGVAMAWSEGQPSGVTYFGVQAINSIQVWKVVDGQEIQVFSAAPGTTWNERLLLRGKTAGLTGVNITGVGTLAATSLGAGVYMVDLGSLARKTYQFTPVGTTSTVGGEFEVKQTTVAGAAGVQEINGGSTSAVLNAYNLPGGASNVVLQYRLVGDTGPYLSKQLAGGSGSFTASYDDVAVGNYEFVLTGTGMTQVTGTFKVVRGGQSLPSVVRNSSSLEVTPLTTLALDAHGNTVVTTRYAKGTSGANVSGYGVPTTDANDQRSINFVDKHGHVVQEVDAEGASRYRSYDAMGHVAKDWQPITNNDGLINNAVHVYQYDKLGRQTATIDPSYLPNGVLAASGTPLAIEQQSLTWGVAQYGADGGESGWTPNIVNIGWNEMASWGGGNTYIRVYYSPKVIVGGDAESGYIYGPGAQTYRDWEIGNAATGTQVSWTGDTIWSVNTVQIWKKDAAGTWIFLHNRSSSGAYDNRLTFSPPQQPGTTMVFKYKLTSSSTWSTGTLYNMGGKYVAETNGFGAGTYHFEIQYTRPGETNPSYSSRGTFSVNGASGSLTNDANSASAWTAPALSASNFARNQAQYNAFGEVTAKGLNDGWQEYYHYDNAGRLWRTNKDGAATVQLYDVQGRSTAQIRSQTLNLASYATAADVAALTSNVMRTNTHYDKLGHVTKQVEQTFNVDRSLDLIPAPISMPQLSVSFGVAQYGYDGGESGWVPNIVNLSWNDMTSWGGGNVWFRVYYSPKVIVGGDAESGYVYGPGAQTYRDYEIGSANSAQISWTGDTIWSLDHVMVQKRDPSGTAIMIHNQNYNGASGHALVWQTPTAVGTTVVIKYKPTSVSTWSTATPKNFGTSQVFDTRGLAAGNYDYEILYTRPNEAFAYAHKTGVFTVGAGGVSDTTQSTIFEAITPVTLQTLDRWGNVITVTDSRGGVTTNRYNYLDKMVEQKQPQVAIWAANGTSANALPVVRNYYDSLGRAVGTIDANGNANTARYDAAGQLIAEYHADGGVVYNNYDALGRRIRTIDALNNTTDYTYDRLDRLTKEKRPIGEDNYAYDQAGNRKSSTNALGFTTSYWYDTRGKMIRSKLPGGQETNYYYDLRGLKTKEVNGSNDSSTSGYDYFGRTTAHTDLGGATFGYTYNLAGQMTAQTSSRGLNQTMTYYENGQLKQQNDAALNTQTLYEYDAAGNRVRERFIKAGNVHLDNRISFDALNRITEVKDNRYTISYGYDANGNRRKAVSDYYDINNAARHVDNWYLYDSMNRITLSQGVLSGGQIVINSTQGIQLQYDAVGNRRVATKYESGSPVAESYNYDANNRLTTTSRSGQVTSSRSYDAAGRVTQIISYNSPGSVKERRENYYNSNNWISYLDVFNGGGTLLQRTTYTGYNALGNVTSYQMSVYTGTAYTNYYSYAYSKYDSYKENVVYGSSSYFSPGNTTTTYDVNGNIVSVNDQFAANRYRSFVVDTSGKILQKAENGQTQYYFYANDKPIGSSGALSAADFDYNYTPVSAQYPAPTPGSYVVSQGDNLRSIAMAVFGDPQLWYIIADANGLRSDSDLKVGQQITIPNRISNIHNTDKTFKVYSPGEIIGDTTPTLPDPPPPPPPPSRGGKGGGCGGIGMIIIIVVAIVAAVFTAGAALAAMAPALTSGMSMWAAGMAAMTGTITVGGAAVGLGAMGLAAAAIGGAVGSIASQLVGIGIGAQDKFSWKAVATSAVTAGFGSGMGSLAAGAGGLTGTGNMFLNAAAQNAASQGLAIAMGQQDKFSWRSMAMSVIAQPVASAAGGMIGGAVGDAIGAKTTAGIFAERFVSGAVSGYIMDKIGGGGKVDLKQVAADAFKHALGNYLAPTADRASQQTGDLVNTERRILSYATSDAGEEIVIKPYRASGSLVGADTGYRLPDTDEVAAAAARRRVENLNLWDQGMGTVLSDAGGGYKAGDIIARGDQAGAAVQGSVRAAGNAMVGESGIDGLTFAQDVANRRAELDKYLWGECRPGDAFVSNDGGAAVGRTYGNGAGRLEGEWTPKDSAYVLKSFTLAAEGGEHLYLSEGKWLGHNGNYYSTNWGGNQWTGGRSVAVGISQGFGVVAHSLVATSVGINAYQGTEAALNGDGFGVANAGANTMIAIGTAFGGPVGWAIGAGYLAAEVSGVRPAASNWLSNQMTNFADSVNAANAYAPYVGDLPVDGAPTVKSTPGGAAIMPPRRR